MKFLIQKYTSEQLLNSLNKIEKRHAPEQLFVAGNVDILRKAGRIAVIGSREATLFGQRRAAKLVKLLVDKGIVVVSGLANGIDTIVHETAINYKGTTIAVLGTPLDKNYPSKNTKLQKLIMTDHLAVSQFSVGSSIQRSNFPARNRTMALLSDVSVIVEAGEFSGCRSQGWETLRLRRPLFILQSLIDNASFEWPKKMIKCGAQVLSDDTIDNLFAQVPKRHPDDYRMIDNSKMVEDIEY